jgi:hypothetical protein
MTLLLLALVGVLVVVGICLPPTILTPPETDWSTWSDEPEDDE